MFQNNKSLINTWCEILIIATTIKAVSCFIVDNFADYALASSVTALLRQGKTSRGQNPVFRWLLKSMIPKTKSDAALGSIIYLRYPLCVYSYVKSFMT